MKSRSLCPPPTSRTQVRAQLELLPCFCLLRALRSLAVFCISWLTRVNGCVPGVLGCPRSCLHAILSLLQRGTEKRSGPVLTQQAPHLAELCYQVHHPDTSNEHVHISLCTMSHLRVLHIGPNSFRCVSPVTNLSESPSLR